MRSRSQRSRWAYMAFLLPAALVVCGLMIYPVINGVELSFRRSATYDVSNAKFIGLHNYREFFQYPDHWALIIHSYIRAIGGVVPSAVLGLGAAIVLNRRRRLGRGLQIATLLPFVISAPVSIFMWELLISPQFGVGRALGVHLPSLLINTTTVWPTLLFINAWASFPFYTIILLAALQRVPQDLYDAAAADGASRFRQFWHVTLPGIAVVGAAACAFHFMASFQDIPLVYIATGGGPLNVTQTVSTYAYQTAFGAGFNIGYAAAIAMISLVLMILTMVLLAGFGVLIVRGRRRWMFVQHQRRRARITATSGAPLRTRPMALFAMPFARRARERRLRSGRLSGMLGTGLAVILGLFALFPILFIISQALDGSPPGSGTIRLWPRSLTLHNFVYVLSSPSFYHSSSTTQPALAQNFLNSVIVSGTVTVLVLVLGSIAGYALARWNSWTPRAVTGTMLVIQFVPQVILVFPLYELLARIGLLNSREGLIMASTAVSLPIAVLFFRVFFHEMPRELEEAASIDGAGTLRTFIRIVAPNARTAFGAMGAFTLIGTWNEFLLAMTLISDPAKRTFPPALQQFTQLAFAYADKNNTPGVQAVYLLLPIISSALLLSFTVRHFTAAVQGGGIKG